MNIVKDKGYVLASMVPLRTLNIHGTFPFHRRFFMGPLMPIHILYFYYTHVHLLKKK